MAETLYTRDILRLASQLEPNACLSDDIIKYHHIGHASKNSPICGSKASVNVAWDDKGRIVDAAFNINSCAMGQASAALLISYIHGKTMDEIIAMHDALKKRLAGADNDISDYPRLAILDAAIGYNARHGAILLPYETLLSATENSVKER